MHIDSDTVRVLFDRALPQVGLRKEQVKPCMMQGMPHWLSIYMKKTYAQNHAVTMPSLQLCTTKPKSGTR